MKIKMARRSVEIFLLLISCIFVLFFSNIRIFEKRNVILHEKKIIIIWTELNWLGDYAKLKENGCPSWNCEFITNRSRLNEADAVIFRENDLGSISKTYHNPSQVWVWLDVEAPRRLGIKKISHKINWTMSYHRNADVSPGYGSFFVPTKKKRPLRGFLMSSNPETLEAYLKARTEGINLEEVMGSEWRSFVDRPRLVSWLSGHCYTSSRREEYVNELQKYIIVDTFGACGKQKCYKKDWMNKTCWVQVMRPNYLFNLAMENSICRDYTTEKLYQSLYHGIVPVVYGGANYTELTPPGSVIDARNYHPRDLANYLVKLKNDPVEYGRFHVWRKFWKVTYPGTMCELCYKLHKPMIPKHYQDIDRFREENGQCLTPHRQMFKNGKWKQYIAMNHN